MAKKVNKGKKASAPKKKATKKKAGSKVTAKKATKKTSKKLSGKPSKRKSAPKKKNPKKTGRKPSVSNRYNSIKSAISDYYKVSIGRSVKHYELKVIYAWINQQYGNQSIRYILMNIDVIVDNFWTEYCNMYPVDLKNHQRFFDWYLLKGYLDDEKDYHYPSDIIQLDLSEIGETDAFEFFFNDYINKADEAYRLCKEAGFKNLRGVYPNYYLESAYCDVAKKGNVYKYRLLIDGEIPEEEPITPISSTPVVPISKTPVQTTPVAPVSATPQQQTTAPVAELTPQQVEMELAKQRINKEYELKELKLKALAELLKQKTITFDEYMTAIKSL